MALVVEDGTGLSDANSLVSLQRADEHLAATGWASDWADFETTRREELLISATSILSNSFSFYGTILVPTQSLPFPRKDLRDRENRPVIGVPPLVQNATAELAYSLSSNNFMSDSDLASLESIKVGPIALEVSEMASVTKVIPDSIIRMLSEYGFYRFGKTRMRRLYAG